MTLDLRRLSYALGAEVLDINVGKPMSESTFGEIHRAKDGASDDGASDSYTLAVGLV